MSKKRIFFLIIAVIFAYAPIASCSGDKNTGPEKNPQNTEGANSNSDDALPAAEEYVYPEINGNGSDFRFLNTTTNWGFYTDIVRDEITGEVLDDAIYNRNRFIEEKFNVNITETGKDIWDIYNELQRVILSGSDEYEAVFCPVFCAASIGGLITQGMFYNMRDISTMNLGGEWWNQTMMEEAAIGRGNKLYYAGCDINIMTLESVNCVYFNENMMADLGLDLPYGAVRQGKWTFEMFNMLQKTGANLNGDDSFKWSARGNAVYGFTSYEACAIALLAGSLERFIVTDKDGNPNLAIGGERFFNVLGKVQEMLTVEGEYLWGNDGANGEGGDYISMFSNDRALMMMGELNAVVDFRQMESAFGILPIPKYDENQPKYYSYLIYQTPVLIIPSTNTRADFTGAVLDAMAYVSNKDVTPVFFDISVSQKGLRNEDSIDMLGIIKNSGSFDVGCAYGWTVDFYESIRLGIGLGKPFDIASAIEKYKPVIEIKIEETMKLFN